MSVGNQTTALLDDLSRLSRQQWLLRAVPLPATVAFLVLVSAAGASFRVPAAVAAVLLGVLVTVVPDSGAALGLLAVLVGLWLLAVPEQVDGWTLLAGLDLLVLHLAVTLASYGPPSTTLEPAMLGTWARRALLLACVGAVTWLVARLAAGAGAGPTGWTMAVGLATLLAWTGYLSVRLAGGPSE